MPLIKFFFFNKMNVAKGSGNDSPPLPPIGTPLEIDRGGDEQNVAYWKI